MQSALLMDYESVTLGNVILTGKNQGTDPEAYQYIVMVVTIQGIMSRGQTTPTNFSC